VSAIAEILQEFSPDILGALVERLEPEEQGEFFRLMQDEEHSLIEEECKAKPLYWLRNHTLTENEQYQKEGLPFKAPFPCKPYSGCERDYYDLLFEQFAIKPKVFVPKSRDMMTSWSAVGWGSHQGQFFKATTVAQTESEDKAKQLVKYAHILYHNQPEWLKAKYPLATDSTLYLEWRDGGRFFGIPCGETKIRIHHPTIYIIDEASFLPGAQALYDAAHPVAGQIIAISSAGEGWFMNQCSR